MRALEIYELKAVAGGELEYDCDDEFEGGGSGGGEGDGPSYVDAKSAPPDDPKKSLAPATAKDGNTTYSNACVTVSAGAVSQQTCVNTDGTTSVQTCVNVGAGVSANYCSTTVSKTQK